MKAFAYVRADSARDAVAAGGTFLAGGTNLVDLMKLGVAEPERLVDVSRLPGAVEERDGALLIGASVRNADAATHPLVREHAPLLARAIRCGASPQLRNVATIGGNLLQRTRCAYFQDVTKPCNKRAAGSGCPAIDGHHRDLAVLGHSEHCVATHPGDMAVALVALGARVHVLGPDGERTIAMPGLHRLPGDEPHRDTELAPGELITAVEVPAVAGRAKYRKVRDRASFSFAVVSVAAQLDLDGDVIHDVRLALGGVAHAPWRAAVAEAQLRGNRPTEAAFAAAADAELAQARPLRDNGFKVTLARNLLVRTLAELAA